MSRRHRHPKPGSLGRAFHAWLEYLEYIEALVVTGKGKGKPKYMSMNGKLWGVDTDEEFQEMMRETIPVDAYLAKVVRSSVKYKVHISTLMKMNAMYWEELGQIRDTCPINLPHEWCSLIIEGFGPDDILLSLMETTSDRGRYTELELEDDEPFISISVCCYREGGLEMLDGSTNRGQQLSYCPIEMHWQKGRLEDETKQLFAHAKNVTVHERGKELMELIRVAALTWLSSFHLQSALRRRRVPGVAPIAPKDSRHRAKWRKKRDHPAFEHEVVELEIDQPDPEQEGRTIMQPRKRMHQVRGFYRHYKSGKVVWVKPHWRGDEQLGVIKKDYEVTLHDEIQPDS